MVSHRGHSHPDTLWTVQPQCASTPARFTRTRMHARTHMHTCMLHTNQVSIKTVSDEKPLAVCVFVLRSVSPLCVSRYDREREAGDEEA